MNGGPFLNFDYPNPALFSQMGGGVSGSRPALDMAGWLQPASQYLLATVMVTIFGVTFPALEISQNGDGSWLMQTLGNSPRGAIGTMIMVQLSEIAGYVAPGVPYFEAHIHGGIQSGGARSGLPKAVGM